MATETNQWGLNVDEEQPHLGGYVPGGDPMSYYPGMWAWLCALEEIGSVLDVGCGDGRAVDWFSEHLGRGNAYGVDGLATRPDEAWFSQHDYTQGPYVPWGGEFDLVWSCEFVEHVAEQHVPAFLSSFAAARKIIAMTHAVPGQGGHHHVNCRESDYWIGALAGIGFKLDETMTYRARTQAFYDTGPDGYFVRTGLIFRPA